MERIPSFQVNHNILEPGIYTSMRLKHTYTLDIRMVKPNNDQEMSTKVMHTIEHLAATFLRNTTQKAKVVYFGPMGCRTGFYAIFENTLPEVEAYLLLKEFFDLADTFTEIPGASQMECGNYKDLDYTLIETKRLMKEFAQQLIPDPTPKTLQYVK